MTQKHIAYTEALARGGVGLIISEGGTIDYPLSADDVFHFRIDKDEYIPGWGSWLKPLINIIVLYSHSWSIQGRGIVKNMTAWTR